jgi:hypothetical protein
MHWTIGLSVPARPPGLSSVGGGSHLEIMRFVDFFTKNFDAGRTLDSYACGVRSLQ